MTRLTNGRWSFNIAKCKTMHTGSVNIKVFCGPTNYVLPAKIKLAASNFAGWFIGVLSRESPILGNFAPQKPKIR